LICIKIIIVKVASFKTYFVAFFVCMLGRRLALSIGINCVGFYLRTEAESSLLIVVSNENKKFWEEPIAYFP
jgi:hypothetical protein